MYIKWAKAREVEYTLLDWSGGDQPRSTTFSINAPSTMFSNETGVHRLTRSSPFGDGRVHTSFARIEVIEYLPPKSLIILKDTDLKVEYFRSGGNGGQNAQKTSTAVRIKHIPTNISAACQAERSQIQNYKQAYTVLTARVQAATVVEKKVKQPAQWGEAFRSYVLNGKLRVKDRLSRFEGSNVHAILDGAIEDLITASQLTRRLTSTRAD